MDEVAGPVIAIALVLSAVFVPIAFLGGITGQFYRQFALTHRDRRSCISALIALTLHAGAVRAAAASRTQRDRALGPFFAWFNRGFDALHQRLLRRGRSALVRTLRSLALLAVRRLCSSLTAWLLSAVPGGFVPTRTRATSRRRPAARRRVAAAHRRGGHAGRARSLKTPGVERRDHASPASASSAAPAPRTSATMFVPLKPWDERKARRCTRRSIGARRTRDRRHRRRASSSRSTRRRSRAWARRRLRDLAPGPRRRRRDDAGSASRSSSSRRRSKRPELAGVATTFSRRRRRSSTRRRPREGSRRSACPITTSSRRCRRSSAATTSTTSTCSAAPTRAAAGRRAVPRPAGRHRARCTSRNDERRDGAAVGARRRAHASPARATLDALQRLPRGDRSTARRRRATARARRSRRSRSSPPRCCRAGYRLRVDGTSLPGEAGRRPGGVIVLGARRSCSCSWSSRRSTRAGAAVRGAARRAVRRARRARSASDAARPRQQHLRPDRPHHADRPRREERDPDRRVRRSSSASRACRSSRPRSRRRGCGCGRS